MTVMHLLPFLVMIVTQKLSQEMTLLGEQVQEVLESVPYQLPVDYNTLIQLPAALGC